MDYGESSYRRYLDGDKDAFDDLMKAYFDPLVFFLCRYLRDPHLAEDVAIDVFTELVVHPHRYHFGVTLKTYLFMLGRSRALNVLRRQKRRPQSDLEDHPTLPDEGPTPEELFLSDERKKELHRAIDTLPQGMKEALHLVYFEGLSYKEVAKILKKTPKQIDNLLYRAKGILRTALQEEGMVVYEKL